MTAQGDRQASVRAASGTQLTYEGDWHALFDAAGIGAGEFGGRLLAWINRQLAASNTEINGAMQAFAASQGFPSWSGMGVFTIGGHSTGDGFLLENGADLILLEDGLSFLLQEDAGFLLEDGADLLLLEDGASLLLME